MLTLTILGDPAPWQVFTKRGPMPVGIVKKNIWQIKIQDCLKKNWNQPPLNGPVILDTEFYLPWPESAPQRASGAIERWYQSHLVMKPDLDNLRKAFSDACEGILYHGDQQVVRGESRKDILRPTVHTNCAEGYTKMQFRSLEV